MFKKKYLIISALAFTFLSSCDKQEQEYQKQYETYEVSSGSLEMSNTFVGYTYGYIETNLSTKTSGRITFLEKNVGDDIIAGEKLVSLDSGEAKTSFTTASNLIGVFQDLKNSIIKSYDDQIKAMESKINQANIYYNGTLNQVRDTNNISETQLKSQESNINSAQLALETAQLNYDESFKNLELEKEHIVNNSKSAIVNSVILYNNILTYVDNLLGVTNENKDKNDAFEDYLGAKDSSLVSIAEEDFNNTLMKFQAYKNDYETQIENSLTLELSDEEIKQILDKGEFTGESIKVLLKNTWDILDNTISSIGSLSDEQILSYKNQISDFGSQVEKSILTVSGNYMLGLKGSIQSLETFNSNKETTLKLLNKQISLAKANLDSMNSNYSQTEAQTSGNLTNIETISDIAENSLEELNSSLEALKSQKESKIKEIDSQITQAKGNKSEAGVYINNGEITAPFTGIITKKNGEVGQVVNAGFSILTLSDNLKIKLKLSLSDYILDTIKLGDDLNIKIEGLDNYYTGVITNIPQSKDQVTKKTTIEILINNDSKSIKIGSLATVEFIQNTSKDLIIPNSSIISDYLIPSVYILNGNKIELKNIKIINQTNDFSSIEGLNLGDIIISSGKENLYNGEELN